jgi:hypothetical protein
VRVTGVPTGSPNAFNQLVVAADPGLATFVEILHYGPQLAFNVWVNNNLTMSVGSVAYDSGQHAWWRLREAAGTLYWELSSDGLSYVVHAELAPPPFPLDAVYVALSAGRAGSSAVPSGSAHYDDLNLPP